VRGCVAVPGTFLIAISVALAFQPEGNRETVRKDCMECHKKDRKVFGGRFVHKPVSDGNCQICHDAGKRTLKRKGESACVICHYEQNVEFGKRFKHPLGKDGCQMCHNPHSASDRRLLRDNDDVELCVRCHINQKSRRSHPIGPSVVDKKTNKPLTCISHCHFPHSSDNKFILKMDGTRELCISCHKEFSGI
jgi:predicted CXXCH cytochrome family protein